MQLGGGGEDALSRLGAHLVLTPRSSVPERLGEAGVTKAARPVRISWGGEQGAASQLLPGALPSVQLGLPAPPPASAPALPLTSCSPCSSRLVGTRDPAALLGGQRVGTGHCGGHPYWSEPGDPEAAPRLCTDAPGAPGHTGWGSRG